MNAEIFYDTNIVLYLLSADAAKADRAEELLAMGGIVSVQVLNEFTAVARRKLQMSWTDIREIVMQIRQVCTIVNLTPETHERACELAERYQYTIYDASILAAALRASCAVVYSEDMQDGQLIEQQLTIRNPFGK